MFCYAASFYLQNLMSQWAKSYALLCCVMICYADLFYEQNPMLSMSKILWSVMLPLLRDYDWNICEQNLMHCYEFLSNEQNLIRPYEIDRFILKSRVEARMASRLALRTLMPEVPGSSPVAGSIYFVRRRFSVFESFQTPVESLPNLTQLPTEPSLLFNHGPQ